MARIIELSGTPGAGKSTLYKEMTSSWSNSQNWIPAHFLYPKLRPQSTNFKSLLQYAFQKLIKGKKDFDIKAMREAGDRFVAQNQPYLDACWHNIVFRQKETFNGIDLRFKKAGFLYTTIQQVQTIKENNFPKYGLIDEGLIHKVTGGGLYKSNNEDEENKELLYMLDQTPLPDALVFLYADVAETTQRLSQRKRVINMHKSLSAEEIRQITQKTALRMDFANKYLERKGVPVLHLNAALCLDEKKSKLNAFFHSLQSF